MLRFIFPVYPLIFHKPPFQYIPCYGLSSPSGSLSLSTLISIHPMLRFIDFVLCIINRTSDISIHPMLRFIVVPSAPTPTIVPDFNTSHVTVYHRHQLHHILFHPYFNTSHVTVYQDRICLLKVTNGNFNTSHVTVYLTYGIYVRGINAFQYIPCYGLSISPSLISNFKKISIHPMLRFICGSAGFFR